MRMYRVEYYLRSTAVGMPFGAENSASRSKWVTVDGIGLRVSYNTEQPPSDNEIRHHLVSRERHSIFLEGGTVQEALEKLTKFEGYNVGDGTSEERRGLWADPEHPIMEFPDCPHMFRNRRKELICGEEHKPDAVPEDEWFPGLYGMCFIKGYEAPDFCPVFPVLRTTFEIGYRPKGVQEIEFRGRKYQFLAHRP